MKNEIILFRLDRNTADAIDYIFSSQGFSVITLNKEQDLIETINSKSSACILLTTVRAEGTNLSDILSQSKNPDIKVIVFTEEKIRKISTDFEKMKNLYTVNTFDDNWAEEIKNLVSLKKINKFHSHS